MSVRSDKTAPIECTEALERSGDLWPLRLTLVLGRPYPADDDEGLDVDQRFFPPFNAARSDSMRPAMDRICVGVALPVRSALLAMLASPLLGGFSGVVFLAILVLPFEGFT